MYLFQEGERSLLSGDIWFEYGESSTPFGDLIRDYPAGREQIHIWEFERPGDLPADGHLGEDEHGNRRVPSPHASFRFSSRIPIQILKRSILGAYLDCEPSDIRISCSPFGKPLVNNIPGTLHITSAYARQTWMLAVSTGYRIGIDIENIQDAPGLLGIAERFFHPEEWKYLQSLSPGMQVQVFFRLWTLKEAFLKAIGTGWSGWGTLPDLTPLIDECTGVPTRNHRLPGGYRAHAAFSDALCEALVYREIPENTLLANIRHPSSASRSTNKREIMTRKLLSEHPSPPHFSFSDPLRQE